MFHLFATFIIIDFTHKKNAHICLASISKQTNINLACQYSGNIDIRNILMQIKLSNIHILNTDMKLLNI